MTRLGSPVLSSQSFLGFPSPFLSKIPETDWDDTPGLPRLVIPFRFQVFRPFFGQENPKQTGMTSLGSSGLSSQSVSGVSGRKGPTKTRNGPGKPRLVMPVRFGAFWPKRAKKTRNGLGRQAWEAQVCYPGLFRGFLAEKG